MQSTHTRPGVPRAAHETRRFRGVVLFAALGVTACFVLGLRGGEARSARPPRPEASLSTSAAPAVASERTERRTLRAEQPACPAPDPALAQDPRSAERVAETLSDLIALFRARLPEAAAYAELRRCRSFTENDACKALLTDALYEVMSMHGMPAIITGSMTPRTSATTTRSSPAIHLWSTVAEEATTACIAAQMSPRVAASSSKPVSAIEDAGRTPRASRVSKARRVRSARALRAAASADSPS
jgi:hypothetical protein